MPVAVPDDAQADGRNISVPAHSSVSSRRPLSGKLYELITAVNLGGPWD